MDVKDVSVDALIDALIEREGGYVNHPADKGGPTCFGITAAVARANGYAGDMRHLPREEAAGIYRRLYWLRPKFDQVAKRAPRAAAELFDTGVNMGPAVAVTFLQRALTALNRGGSDYPDLTPDGRVGAMTLHALDAFLEARGMVGGGDGTAARPRGTAGGALPAPRRAPAGKRGISLRLASQPNWLAAQINAVTVNIGEHSKRIGEDRWGYWTP